MRAAVRTGFTARLLGGLRQPLHHDRRRGRALHARYRNGERLRVHALLGNGRLARHRRLHHALLRRRARRQRRADRARTLRRQERRRRRSLPRLGRRKRCSFADSTGISSAGSASSRAISYIIIALGLAAMIYHGFQGGQGFQPSTCCAWVCRLPAVPRSTCSSRSLTTDRAVTPALAGLDLSDESITTAGTDGKGFVDPDPDARSRTTRRPCGTRSARSRRSIGPVADHRGRSVARTRVSDQCALGAGDRARHPVPLHRVPIRLELHLRPRDGHRAGSRCG